MANIFQKFEDEVKKVDGVLATDAKKVEAFFAGIFGQDRVNSAISNIDGAAETALGNLVKKSVVYAEGLFGSGKGAAKASWVLNGVSAVASALGIPFSASSINSLIEMFAPFVASAASNAVKAIIG